MNTYARQGDLVISKTVTAINKDKARVVKNFALAGDSSGHPHIIKGSATIEDIGNASFRVQVARKTLLIHGKPGGHKAVPLAAGTYEIRPLRERNGTGDRNVTD